MICSAVHGTVKSDNFLVIPKRPLVIINWPVSVRRPVSDRLAPDQTYRGNFLRNTPFAARRRGRSGAQNLSGSSPMLVKLLAKAEIQTRRTRHPNSLSELSRRIGLSSDTLTDYLWLPAVKVTLGGQASINRACPAFQRSAAASCLWRYRSCNRRMWLRRWLRRIVKEVKT